MTPAPARVHDLCELDDLNETVAAEMRAIRHTSADRCETFEVVPLARHQRVRLEVRDDALENILETPGPPLQRLVAAVGSDASAPEVRVYRMKHLGSISILAHREARPHLPSDEQLRSWRD